MKHIKLLSIISIILVISSCKNETKEFNSENVKVQTVKIDTLVNQKDKDTITSFLEVKDTIKIKQRESQQDSIKKNVVKDNPLKVVIDDKVYYKKYVNDNGIKGNKYHYYCKEYDGYYDIRTGRAVYIYGKHGKVTLK